MKIRKTDEDVYILAIESSCDETAAAVVKNGREVLSNVISSQIALHTLYGGVVPEIASRKHIEKINQVIREALKEASMTLEEMTAIAVTYGPGLVGALLERPLIRWPAPWDWDIPAVLRWTRRQRKEIPMPWNSPGQRLVDLPMTSASAA